MKTTYKRATAQTLALDEATATYIDEVRTRFADDMEAPAFISSHAFKVIANDVEVGFVSLFQRENEIYITQLYIFPDFRNQGFGSMLLEVLSNMEDVDFVRVIATPMTARYYIDRGFEQDLGNIVLTKVAQ